MLKTVKAPSI